MAVRIVTDSSCDLPQPLCDELGIDVVPLTVRFGTEELVDRKEITTEQFWPRMAASSVLPETAAPPVGAFHETFKSLADTGADGIVCINISSKLSATMQSAQIAADRLANDPATKDCPIAVIDSESASMGIGVHVVYAARRAAEGADVDTIVREVEERRARTRLYFTIDTLEFLRRGGRIGGAQALLGSVLSIKPVLTVKDGVVEPVTKVRTRSKALRYLIDKAKEQPIGELATLHANASDIDEFCGMLEPLAPRDEMIVSMIGPVVGVHAGPGTIGVVWVDQ